LVLNVKTLRGERIAVGIDPSKEFLQLAILSPGKQTEFKKLLIINYITEEIVQSSEPACSSVPELWRPDVRQS